MSAPQSIATGAPLSAFTCDVCDAPAVGFTGGGASAEGYYCAEHRPCACGAYLVESGAVEHEDEPGALTAHRRGACTGYRDPDGEDRYVFLPGADDWRSLEPRP